MQNVFIIGSKGIPGSYGGYETFVDKLTEYHQENNKIKYHIACKSTEKGEFEYHGARCFRVKVLNVGSVQAIYYDVVALKACIDYIKKYHIGNSIVYILTCRIGPLAAYFQKAIHKLGGKVYLNPDGHEFLRKKWNMLIRKYWKISEWMMVRHADLLICDSKNIEKYICDSYRKYNPNTVYIAYGAETKISILGDEDSKLFDWYEKNGLSTKSYYLAVGRFVPENNYETMIREFMKSGSKKNFVIITTTNQSFLENLERKLHFKSDIRIKFVGTVYDQKLLMKIRENAYANFHGHEVGGTNPSLLEALGSTDLNLLYDVGFNHEVAEAAALYWSKEEGELAQLIAQVDGMKPEEIAEFGQKARQRIADAYTWEKIVEKYERLFLGSSTETSVSGDGYEEMVL